MAFDRPLFDPSMMSAKKRAETPDAPGPASAVPAASVKAKDAASPPVTVSQLAAMVQEALTTGLPAAMRVVGEVSQFRERTHFYFDIKDEASVVSCVMFASAAKKCGIVPEVGQQVVVTGRIDFYARQGRTTFMVDKLEPVGAGAQELAFRKLCDELRALGWFDESRKRPLPMFPRRIAVVTSRTGAALQDVLDTCRRRCCALEIGLIDVRVQGPSAAAEIARVLGGLSRDHAALGIDVILLTRGGGSREDLAPFNERILAEAIVACAVPVVAAIGHETDTTVAELVADLRCATPTQAAMRIAPDTEALKRQLTAFGSRLSVHLRRQVRHDASRLSENSTSLRSAIRHRIASDRDRLHRASAALERHRPIKVYAERSADLRRASALLQSAMHRRLAMADLGALECRLENALRARLTRAEQRLYALTRALDLVGPVSVMKRGYSLTMLPDGRAVRSVKDVEPGAQVTTRVADGEFTSRVASSTTDNLLPVSRPRTRKRPGPGNDDQNSLFGAPPGQ